ncbi:MAG: acyltransferase [Bacilli bacterium]|nr:acyltransferase [Bacilli bacterium]
MGSSNSNKNYYKYLDIIRVFLCIVIFLYHLGLLKGGFLAVNVFFALSGYLAFVSASKDSNFSIKKYYLKRLKSIYLPLVMVVFLTLAIVPLFSRSNWLNLKPETFSVLLGYNNFWQLGASLDYFARHIDSPFMHLWFIAILMQFDLVFPIVFRLINKTKSNISKICDSVIIFLLALLSFLGFYYFSLVNNMMVAYYNTLFRCFSLLFGLLFGMLHASKNTLILEEFKKGNKPQAIIICYLLILLLFFLNVDVMNRFFQVSMIVVTIIACRIFDYAIWVKQNTKDTPVETIIKKTAKITYEFYLVQYPIIYAFQSINIGSSLKYFLIFIITAIVSYIIHYALNFYNKKDISIKKFIVFICLLLISCYGIVVLITSKDYSKEMKQLEKELADNQELILKKQDDYAKKIKEQKDELSKQLELIEENINNMEGYVKSLSVIGVGDSVMLGAVNNLYEIFPNGYFDAKVSRSTWTVNSILQDLDKSNMLGDVVVINMGANGDCSEECKEEIMKTIGNRKAFWLTNTCLETAYVNDNITEFAKKHFNLHILDWKSISKGHDEYFYADGIHLTIPGRAAYAQAIYEAIYNLYMEEYQVKSEQTIQDYEDNLKNKYEFYGNDLLLGSYQYIINDFIDSKFNIESYDFSTLKKDLEKKYNLGELSKRIVLVFDSSFKMSTKQYKELTSLLKDTKIYIIYLNDSFDIKDNNTQIIDFNKDLKNNSDYLLGDLIHLSTNGNKALANKLIDTLLD